MQKKLLLSILMLTLPLFSQQLTVPQSIEKVTTFLLNQEYQEARQFISNNTMTKIDSLFAVILIENAELVDYESYAVKGEKFLALCNIARKELQKTTEYKRPVLHHYYFATIEGAAAVTRGKRNDFAGALTASNVSKKYFKMILSTDSSFAPAKYGIALREFYSSSVTTKVGVGKKSLAASIATMKEVTSHKTVAAHSLQPSLFWVYMDLQEYQKSELLAQRFLEIYPNNTIMMRGLAKVQMVQKKYTESENTARKLMEISEKRSPRNWSDYFSGGVAVVTAAINTNRIPEGSAEIDRLLSISLDANTQKLEWVKKHQKKLRDIKLEISQKK